MSPAEGECFQIILAFGGEIKISSPLFMCLPVQKHGFLCLQRGKVECLREMIEEVKEILPLIRQKEFFKESYSLTFVFVLQGEILIGNRSLLFEGERRASYEKNMLRGKNTYTSTSTV